jgi:hypothetical protein
MQKKELIGYIMLFLVFCVFGYLIYSQGSSLSKQKNIPKINTSVPKNKTVTSNPKQLSETTGNNASKTQTASSLDSNLGVPGWKTYKNQKLGYQLQYPSDWTASDSGKSDPAYPYDMELSKGDNNELYIGLTSSAYGTNPDGTVTTKDKLMKQYTADSNFKKIAIASGEAYYTVEETLGGPSWTVYVVGDKGTVTMACHVYTKSNETLYRQIIGTFRFN